MANNGTPLPVSDLTGGINAFEKQATPNQCVEALDVWERNGDLVRRPAFKPVITAPVYMLPAGAAYVKHEYPLLTFTTYASRNPTSLNVTRVGGRDGRLWVGCAEQFDGIDIAMLGTSLTTSVTNNRKLVVKYRDTSLALNVAHGVVDTTTAKATGTVDTIQTQPFAQAGRISWHKSQFTNWTATTLDGVTAYWIALDVSAAAPQGGDSDPAVSGIDGGGTITVYAPGIRVFVTYPVNGLYTTKLRNATPVIVMGADMNPKRGRSRGGIVGYNFGDARTTEEAFLVDREGSAVFDQITKPAWTHAGAATGTEGTNSAMTKLDQSFRWTIDEQAGGTVEHGTAQNGSTTTVVSFNLSGIPGDTRNYEGYYIVCETAVTPGINVGDTHEIISSTGAFFTVYPPLGAVPLFDVFAIKRRPNHVRTRESGKKYLIAANTEHALTFHPLTATYPPRDASVGVTDTTVFRQFETGAESPWALDASRRQYSYVYDPVTGCVLFTNGVGGIHKFDGYSTRKLAALFDPTDGVEGAAKVSLWTGHLQDEALALGDPDINQGSQLRRTPPDAALIAFYRGHIVCVTREDLTTLQWSAPNLFNDIWPVAYQTRIRDSESNPITGLFTLNEQLIAATASGLHAANPPTGDSLLIFTPVAQGIGFINHQSVCKLAVGGSSVLVGPNTDGIYAFTGASPTALLDSWSRILPNGINPNTLINACGAAWQSESVYFLAVPSAGSAVNDRVVVMDYSDMSNVKFWVWSSPFGGISAICRDFDDTGRERILFGTNDGHLCVLADLPRDGNATITGRAKSPPLAFNGQTMAFTGMRLTVEEIGSSPAMTVKPYVDGERSRQTISKVVQASGALFGTGIYNTATYADRKMCEYAVNFKAGGTSALSPVAYNRATTGQIFQYEIESTARFKFRQAVLFANPKGARMK